MEVFVGKCKYFLFLVLLIFLILLCYFFVCSFGIIMNSMCWDEIILVILFVICVKFIVVVKVGFDYDSFVD